VESASEKVPKAAKPPQPASTVEAATLSRSQSLGTTVVREAEKKTEKKVMEPPPIRKVKNPPLELASKPRKAPADKDVAVSTETALKPKESIGKRLVTLPQRMVKGTFNCITNPRAAVASMDGTWQHVKEEAKHYWVGTKLLWAELGIAMRQTRRILLGHQLSRRERRQLVRTINDLMRLLPFSVFILIPFMELFLPVALAMFPNMLPSTYTTQKKKEENMKRKLRARVEMAGFLQDVMEERADEIKRRKDDGLHDKADVLLEIVDKARKGHPMSNESVIAIAKLFKDDITLDTISRPQLVTLCKFVGVTVFGTPDAVMRMQLRAHLRSIKADDRMIMWEGVHTLTKPELMMACQDRGMRATGVSSDVLRMKLSQWLELSVRQDMPLTLLVLSRVMTVTARSSRLEALASARLEALGSAISRLDNKVVNEAVRASALDGADDPSLKLETLLDQSELIKDEEESKASSNKRRVAEIVTTEEEEEKKHLLSIEELEALNVLASESAVEQEKVEIQQLKQDLREVTGTLYREGPEDAEKLGDIRSRLKTLLRTLEAEADAVDDEIGDKLFLIDKDKDGVISNEEMKDAIKNVLKTHNTDIAADTVVKLLDWDADGNVTKEEMQWFLKKTREKTAADSEE